MGGVATKLQSVHFIGAREKTPNYDSYREFITGFELFGTDDGNALRHFERAAELDSDFPAPRLYAAYIHYAMGNAARAQEIIAELNAQRELLTPLGKTWLDGLSGYTTHRFFEALQHLRLAEPRAPSDPLLNMWISLLAILSNRPQEAVDAYDRLGSQPWPGHPLGAQRVSNACCALHMLGDHRRELEEARRNHPAYSELLRADEVRALAALGSAEAVMRCIDEGLVVHDRMGDSGAMMLEAAMELRAHGRRDASLLVARRAVDWYRERLAREPLSESLQLGLAECHFCAERWDEAIRAFARLAAEHPADAAYSGFLGTLAARAGDLAEAKRRDEELAAFGPSGLFGAATYWRACIAAQLGDRDQAVSLLREALGQGHPYGLRLHRAIALEPLRDYPPFRELIRPKG